MTVLGSPQYGSTVTMGDGTFAMAVNGGGPLVVAYAASGYLQVQRTLNFVPWNDYAVLPDVVLRALDTQASAVDFSGASVVFQVAQGTPTVNSSGTRTATLLIPPGTQASLVTDAGATAVTTLTVRATEYSIGSTGPLAMPGTLPTASAYTYAVELSADEAIAAGASVDFSAPLLSYTDNFLAFTVGQPVPAGYYNTAQGVWVGSPDGLVIAIVSVVDGVANIDVTGDGVADSTASLEAVGITAAEQAALASVYAAPTSLWRVSIPHFSPWDFNWGWGPPPDAGAPSVPGAMQSSPVPDDGCQSDDSFAPNGSTIECQNGILHESIPIAGTPYALEYSSDRVVGFEAQSRLEIPLTGPTLPAAPPETVQLQIQVAGRTFQEAFAPSPNLSTFFQWDGYDVFGRLLQGTQPATVMVGYTYSGVYLTPSEDPLSAAYDNQFGHFSFFGSPATVDPTRTFITLWEPETVLVGHPFAVEPLGFGGWSLSVQNTYDFNTGTLLLGTGERQTTASFGSTINTIAGDGIFPLSGDNGPAVDAGIAFPNAVAIGPDGTIYVATTDGLRQINTAGDISTLFARTEATGVAVGPGGIYWSANTNDCFCIRRVNSMGVVHPVAGDPTASSSNDLSGDGGPATAAYLYGPGALAFAPDGTLYFVDGNSVRYIDLTGTLWTLAGGNGAGHSPDGTPAQAAIFGGAGLSIALAPGVSRGGDSSLVAGAAADDTIYISDPGNAEIRTIDNAGLLRTVAGNGIPGYSGDGGNALSAMILPQALVGTSSGTLYFVDNSTRVRSVNSSGIIQTVAGNGTEGFSGDLGPALNAEIDVPANYAALGQLALSLDRQYLYVPDYFNERVRSVSLQGGFDDVAFSVANQNGTEIYGFDSSGRHLLTTALPSGVTSVQLAYNGAGLLQSVTDAAGNITTLQWDSSKNAYAIVSPLGVTTALTPGPDGYLASVTGPTGAQYQMYYADGLLTSMQFPTGSATAAATKTYDPEGRLTTSLDAAGDTASFLRAPDSPTSIGVTKTTGAGVVTQYSVTTPGTGGSQWTNVLPDGTDLAAAGCNGRQSLDNRTRRHDEHIHTRAGSAVWNAGADTAGDIS